MHPADMVFYWAQANPERLALIQPDMAVTYRVFAEAIEAATARIEKLDLNKEEPVAVAIDHPFRQLSVCFALMRLGIPVALAGRHSLPFLRSAGVFNVITAGEAQVLSGGRSIQFQDSWLRREGHANPTWNASRPSLAERTPLIFLTSGTTGVPKKVVLPGAAILDWARILQVVGNADYDRVLVVPDLNSAMGYNHVSLLFYAGKTACFARGPKDQLTLINVFEIEEVIASPQQTLDLVQAAERDSQYHVSSLKAVRVGGGFVTGNLARRVRARLCRHLTTQYGATETGLIAVANYDMVADVPSAVGFVLPGMRVEIVDDDNKPLGAGTEGRVRFRSDYYAKVFAASYPDRAAEADRVWWYPGDFGRMTDNGILCIEARVDDVINCGGAKLSGIALDEAVCRQPGVNDAGVCVIRGNTGIEEIWIGVESGPTTNLADVARALENESDFGVPVGRIFVVEKIPRNAMGKLQRSQLRDLLIKLNEKASAAPRAAT